MLGSGIGSNIPNWGKIQEYLLKNIYKLGQIADSTQIPDGTFWIDCRKPEPYPEHTITKLDDLMDIVNNTLSEIRKNIMEDPTTLNPHLKQVTINNENYNLVAFYYPDFDTPWDKVFMGQFLANFYPCNFTLTIKNVTGTFQTAEAAFQATKWWFDQTIREQFENAKNGNEAFHIKKNLNNPDYNYAGLERDGAMKEVLLQKFSDPSLQNALILTGDAYLLEHNQKKGRDNYWSDDHDGKGNNMLGKTLMEIREYFGGEAAPKGNFDIADFSNIVIDNYS